MVGDRDLGTISYHIMLPQKAPLFHQRMHILEYRRAVLRIHWTKKFTNLRVSRNLL